MLSPIAHGNREGNKARLLGEEAVVAIAAAAAAGPSGTLSRKGACETQADQFLSTKVVITFH